MGSIVLGTYLPLADAQELARQHNVLDRIGPIFDFVPGAVTPPPAPRHVSKPKQPKKSAAVPQPGPAVKKRKRNGEIISSLLLLCRILTVSRPFRGGLRPIFCRVPR